jgi:hypothetical protein
MEKFIVKSIFKIPSSVLEGISYDKMDKEIENVINDMDAKGYNFKSWVAPQNNQAHCRILFERKEQCL